MPLAYSYLRFSSPQQAKGDSIRRQTEASADWCRRNGAQLDGSLTLRDEGVSAFRGKHRENPDVHGLAAFLAAVKSGRVQPGSFLILENLDRLTREQIVPAVNLFTGLLVAGVRVVQLRPVEHVYDQSSDMTSVMLALVELSRGNSESAMKSARVSAAWANKRKRARERPLTRRVPTWVRVDGDRLALDAGRAAVVRRIHGLARDGMGAPAIAAQLNAEGVPVIGRQTFNGKAVQWTTAVVYFLLTTRAALGEYQPHTGTGSKRKPCGDPIPNYYPPLLTADEWHTTQAAVKSRSECGRGRRGKRVNLFAGLLVDARTGGRMHYKHYSIGDWARLDIVSSDSLNGRGGAFSSFPAVAFEAAILEQLRELRAADLTDGDGDATRRVEALAGRLAAVDQLAGKWRAKMDDPELVDTVAAKLADLGRQRKALASELADAQRAASCPLTESWGEFRSLADLLASTPGDELRLRVRAVLRRTVEAVCCVFVNRPPQKVAAVQVWFRGTGRQRSYAVVYDSGRRPGVGKVGPETWAVTAAAWQLGPGGLDLRRPKDAQKLLAHLSRADLPAVVTNGA
jgi:DNA invertase Pin-like site-specific DNA recombinase